MNAESPNPSPRRGRGWSRGGGAGGAGRMGGNGGGGGFGGEGRGGFVDNVLQISVLWRMAGRLGWAGRAVLILGLVWGLVGVAGWFRARGWWNGGGAGWVWEFFSVGVLWSLAVAVAAVLPLWGYAVAGLWLGWYGVSLMGAWTGTPVVALPVGWWLLVGWWVWRRDRKTWRNVAGRMRVADGTGRGAGSAFEKGMWKVEKGIFGMMAGWCGLLLAGPSGLNRLLGMAGEANFGVMMLIVLPVGAGGMMAMKKWGTGERLDSAGWLDRVDFGGIWAGGLGIMGLGMGLSRWRGRDLAEGWVMSVGEMAGTWTGLLWFWLGFGFGLAVLVGLAESGRIRAGSKARGRSKWAMPAVWLAVTGMEWVLAHDPGVGVGAWLPSGVSNWLQGTGSLRARLMFEAHAWVGVVILVLGIGFLWQGRVTVRLMPRLHAVWVAAFAGIWAGSDGLLAAAFSSGGEGALVLPGGVDGQAGTAGFFGGGGLILILAGGFCWWGRRLVLERFSSGEGRLPGRLGALTLGSGLVCAAGLPGGLETGAGTCAEAALSGMLHFALPVALIWKWHRRSPVGAGLGVGMQAGLGVLGLYMVLPWLERDPSEISQLGLLPVEWAAALFWVKWRNPAISPTGGALAGMMLASAGVAGWMQPGLFFPEVPVLGWLNPPLHVVSAEGGWGDRDFFGSAHFALLMLMTAAGAVLGALIFRRPDRPGGGLIPLILRPIPPTVPPVS